MVHALTELRGCIVSLVPWSVMCLQASGGTSGQTCERGNVAAVARCRHSFGTLHPGLWADCHYVTICLNMCLSLVLFVRLFFILPVPLVRCSSSSSSSNSNNCNNM